MANIKISELNPLLTVEDADVLPIVDNAVTKKVTAAILRSYTQGNSVLLTGAQTVAGIKTFTSQLASSVATGTAPFSVASTTKVTNLNADLLDGLSSADFALSTRTLTAGTGLTGGGDLTANRTFAIDSTVATLTGTQTLTNKTITSPVINEILDSNGNEILGFTPIASATDYITIKNGIGVGVPVHISAAGSSANTGLHLEPKGTGLVQISDGTDTSKGFRFRSSASATGAVTLLDAVSSAGRVITLPDATTTLVGTNTTDTLTNKSISGATNTLSNIGNASLTNSAITINGTSTSLGGSINVGTVTSVAALTLGTSGTDLTSSVATGTTTPVITLNVPTASAANRGALSSTDWSTFNAKQNAITLTTTGTSGAATLVGSTLNIPNYADTDTGITSLNGLTALTQTFAVGTSGTDFGISSATSTHTFNLPTASAANRGALSSADWTTFNNKASTADLANYLPLAGGTLTGALNGTSGSFSGNISSYGQLRLETSAFGSIVVGSRSSQTDFQIYNTGNVFRIYDGTDDALSIATTGAATFRSSVTAGASISIPSGNFFVYDAGVGFLGSGSSISTGSSSQLGIRATNEILFATGGATERMRITSAGNVGIGTTSANGKLTVKEGATSYELNTTADYVQQLAFDRTAGLYKIMEFRGSYFVFSPSDVEKMRLSTTGNLLIGTTTDAGYKLDVNGNGKFLGVGFGGNGLESFGANGGNGIYSVAGGSAGSGVYGFTSDLSSYSGTFEHTGAGAGIALRVLGRANFSLGIGLNSETAGASGIQFPSTQVASASANNLDDYEEGTFTPSIAFGGASVGVTFDVNSATYTKIGRQVTVNGYLILSNKGTSIGNASITGLPFTAGNTVGNFGAASLWFNSITFTNQFQGRISQNQNDIGIFEITILGAVTNLTDVDFSNNSQIMISATYFV